MTPSALRRLAAILDGPDPWPEVLPAVEAEPITSAQRERLLRVFDATAGGSPSAPPRAARGRMETMMSRYERQDQYATLRAMAERWLAMQPWLRGCVIDDAMIDRMRRLHDGEEKARSNADFAALELVGR